MQENRMITLFKQENRMVNLFTFFDLFTFNKKKNIGHKILMSFFSNWRAHFRSKWSSVAYQLSKALDQHSILLTYDVRFIIYYQKTCKISFASIPPHLCCVLHIAQWAKNKNKYSNENRGCSIQKKFQNFSFSSCLLRQTVQGTKIAIVFGFQPTALCPI